MGFQTGVNVYNALGFPGDLAFDGPLRAQTCNLDSDGQAQTVGFAFTHNDAGANPNPVGGSPDAGLAKVGGTGVFAGILVNPKAYASAGGSTGPLSPTLNLPDNSIGELLLMGEIFVILPAAANVGDLVYYDNTTGALASTAPSGAATGAATASATLTVTGISSGAIGIGSKVYGTDGNGVEVIALGTGTGGNGTYTLNKAVTVAGPITFTSVAPSGKTLVPNCRVSRYAVAGAGTAVIKLTN